MSAPNHPRSHMHVRTDDIFRGQYRMQAGIILTIREQTTDERRCLHRNGKKALEGLCWDIEELDGEWKVISMCTPTSIWRDLQGTRETMWGDRVQFPELTAFGRIGRMDLLDPFFDPHIPRGRTHF